MTFITDIIKGIFIGIANIIPGVSGGTIALSMGIYDKLIGAVSGFFKDWKKSILTLLPILVGCGIGLVGFTYAIEYLLSEHTFVTCMTFIGLILGGLPILIRQLKGKVQEQMSDRQESEFGSSLITSVGFSGILCFLLLFTFAIVLPLLGSDEAVLRTLTATPGLMLIMFFIGIIASATMVIPGVSGSLVLMILGYYYGIIEAIKTFLDALKAMNIPVLTNGFLVLAPFGLGVLLGIFLIAKLITFLFERYGVQTYCAILGLILSSPFAIFYNTGLFGQLKDLNLMLILAGVILAIVGGVITYLLGERD